MSWGLLDDHLWCHPKVMALKPRMRRGALAAWTVCNSYMAMQSNMSGTRTTLVPHCITTDILKELKVSAAEAEELCRVGLWIKHPGGEGYAFHDWEEYRAIPKASKRGARSKSPVDNSPGTDPAPIPIPIPIPKPIPTPKPSTAKAVRCEGVQQRPPSPRRKKSLAKTKPEEPTAVALTWRAYSGAYRQRYGVAPTHNAKVNGQLKQFTERVPKAEAPHIAGHYLGSRSARYVAAGHPIGMLLQDAEKLRTEWATGRSSTNHQAREDDRMAGRGAEFAELFAKFDAEEAEEERAKHGKN